ncbi:hypothetical protein [Phyllobacterium lublinensis]|uniref:hypothetical protein n=1 Tax=Phyllobacterium lublinensis TaxID=2875708 RepID=UPI001CCEC34E|nr:hypothetical protein [Phyllobacterium sp. 2063]MBZ9656853.1 hypothetical protein [Phyllobacterium sp. 2063]
MLGFGDQISESIAHFVGYFHTSIEAARARVEYREFNATPDKDPHLNDILTIQTDPGQRLDLGSFQSNMNYLPAPWSPVGEVTMPWVNFVPIEVDVAGIRLQHPVAKLHSSGSSDSSSSIFHTTSQAAPNFGPPPIETHVAVQQTNHMEDNDVVMMGNHAPSTMDFVDVAAFNSLTDSALSISEPLTQDTIPGSGAELEQFFNNQIANIQAAEQGPLATTPGVTVVTAPSGHYVNGVETDEAPKLDDYVPEQLKPSENDSSATVTTTTQSLVIDSNEIIGSVEVQAGCNILVNEVVINSLGGSVGAHFAVGGSYYNINAIVQTNAYSDSDTFQNGFGGQQSLGQPATNAMNVASFLQQVDHGQSDGPSDDAPVFPQAWQVTVVNGDLIQMNWISQYNFLSDNDAHVLSATGSYTTIVTGANMTLNTASFAELCNSYDLVMIGGNMYNGNFIFQTNILFDNDTFTTCGAAGAYDGELSSSDNLLWNQASIQSDGPANWVAGLPSHYLEAMNDLATGSYNMPSGFHGDQALQGLEGLRVLYISGNVYDVNYIEQTNVLGDADYVEHYEDALLTASSDTVWDISTGSNALINIATIIDHDPGSGGTSYAGGGVYSDAILIQADIINTDPGSNHPTGQGQQLANEIVAFLENEGDSQHCNDDHAPPVHVPDTCQSVDVMQTVLA